MPGSNNYSGQIVGNYLMMERLGSGEFGSVYRAQNRMVSERVVAIKLINDKYVSSQEECRHFLNEARMLLKLQHPYILPVFDIGEYQGVPYIVLEFAPTGSLRNYLEKSATLQLPLNQALTTLAQVGQGLHHAHLQHVIHRDLKPENILFNMKGDALLADFGIATEGVTSTNSSATITGTPPYMAPEQFQGTVSKLSDQYALGCIAYEIVTGRRPFQAGNFAEWAIKHTNETPISPRQFNPVLPTYVEEALLKAMSKERTQRFKDVSAFIAAISPQGTYPPAPIKTMLKSSTGLTVLSNTDITIGRASDNAFVISDSQVSGHHAVVRRHGQGYAITDLNSTNKTYVNGQAIPANTACVLKLRDNIRIGATTFEYTDDMAAPGPAAPSPPTIVVPPPVVHVTPINGQLTRPILTRTKSHTGLWVLSTIVGLLVIFAIVGSLVSRSYIFGPTPTPTSVPTPIPTSQPIPTPTPTIPPTQATLSVLNQGYSGTITDSNRNPDTMTLVSIQENQSGSIRGGVLIPCPFDFCSSSGSPTGFGGLVDTTHAITFSFNAISSSGAVVIITFTGTVSSDNATMRGTYTGNDGESGTWSVTSS